VKIYRSGPAQSNVDPEPSLTHGAPGCLVIGKRGIGFAVGHDRRVILLAQHPLTVLVLVVVEDVSQKKPDTKAFIPVILPVLTHRL